MYDRNTAIDCCRWVCNHCNHGSPIDIYGFHKNVDSVFGGGLCKARSIRRKYNIGTHEVAK